MKRRLAGILAVAAVGFAIAAAVFAATSYATLRMPRPTDTGVPASQPARAVYPIWNLAAPDPSVPSFPALPSASHLPASLTSDQRDAALLWLEQQGFVTQCMADAGFPGYRYVAAWQPGQPADSRILWREGLSGSEVERSAVVLFGTIPNGDGPDYHWDLGGCNGYGWHMIGVDHPY